jgi:hypothetical protein
MGETVPGADNTEPQHEERDVRLRPLIISGIGLAILAGTALLAMVWLFDYLAGRQVPQADYPALRLEGERPPPEPRLQVAPQRDIGVMRAEEQAILQSYGWVDRQAGIVRIPIAHAIDLLADKAEQGR